VSRATGRRRRLRAAAAANRPRSPRRRTSAGHRSPRLIGECHRQSGFSPPPHRQGAPVSYRLHPHARRVTSPSWVLERRLLLRLCRCAPGRASAVAMGRARCAHGPSQRCGRGPRATAQLGRARFQPSSSRISFSFSEYIQILANLKICVGFI
jgi:hypothetical protein